MTPGDYSWDWFQATKTRLSGYVEVNLVNYVKKVSISAVVLLLLLAACSDDETAMKNCIDRGMEFYRGKGNYTVVTMPPNTGRLVEEVVQERCERSTAAF